jgi:hypothetical protein
LFTSGSPSDTMLVISREVLPVPASGELVVTVSESESEKSSGNPGLLSFAVPCHSEPWPETATMS